MPAPQGEDAMPTDDLPEGLPELFDGPSAWIGDDMARTPGTWLHTLTDDDLAELEAAAASYLATGRDIGEIDAASFDLPTLAPRLGDLRDTLIHGIGFRVLRGLPVDRLSQHTAAAIFCGIGAHLGRARSQNAAGHILGHVRDQGADATDPNGYFCDRVRMGQTSKTSGTVLPALILIGALVLTLFLFKGK